MRRDRQTDNRLNVEARITKINVNSWSGVWNLEPYGPIPPVGPIHYLRQLLALTPITRNQFSRQQIADRHNVIWSDVIATNLLTKLRNCNKIDIKYTIIDRHRSPTYQVRSIFQSPVFKWEAPSILGYFYTLEGCCKRWVNESVTAVM